MSVVIEVTHQCVQNNNFSPYVISRFCHIHMHILTHIRLSENLPMISKISFEMETIKESETNTIHNETTSDIAVTPVLNVRPSRIIQPPTHVTN